MSGGLEGFRARLDEVDDELARLFGERFDICRDVARFKSAHSIPMMQPDRVVEVRNRYLARGAAAGLPAEFSNQLFDVLIAATCRMEDEIIAALERAARDEAETA
jgi:chorismate mutase-like protein